MCPSIMGKIRSDTITKIFIPIYGNVEIRLCLSSLKGEWKLSEWKELNKESQTRWDGIAEIWDDYMGEDSN